MLLWTWLFACHGGDGTDTTPSTDGATSESGTSTGTSSSSTSTSGTPTDPGVTFYHDVRPLLAESCARCHTGTGFGPGPFLDYDVSKQWAEVMLTELEAGQMPPPAADPTCHPYVDQEVYQADPALHDTLKAWIDAGEPAGVDPGTDLQPEAPATLDSPDLVLKTATPRAPNFKDGNEYRCFLIGRIDTDEYVTALEFVIDHPEITHHALLLLDTGGTAHNKVTDEATQSWGCSVTDLPGGIIHAWAPSGGALTFPQGTGLHLPVGSELIIQMHYYQAVTDVFEDQPGYAFDVAPTVDREMYYLTVGPLWFTIPAGDPSYTKNYKMPVSWVSSSPLDVWGAFPTCTCSAPGTTSTPRPGTATRPASPTPTSTTSRSSRTTGSTSRSRSSRTTRSRSAAPGTTRPPTRCSSTTRRRACRGARTRRTRCATGSCT